MLCFKPSLYENLPTQDVLCREPGSMCGYVEKALPLSNWERRLAVITRDGKLIIYKYYLLDICPGIQGAPVGHHSHPHSNYSQEQESPNDVKIKS
ncbi:hypothetical protein KIN20_027469 [Parelaphostrongylus tenuis]|uniref:PH-15 domain-containing protein n=1 Tax=Parelaphostrongylus tenuis TaxID=148309 RepID=A0AAD5QZL4_PARTN|nr:hypothetical protein KIN20_027469 [Parelaphostrongylus tenuis]